MKNSIGKRLVGWKTCGMMCHTCMPTVTCQMSSVICHLSTVIRHVAFTINEFTDDSQLRILCDPYSVILTLWFLLYGSVICHLSPVICHLSSVICHLSTVILHLPSTNSTTIATCAYSVVLALLLYGSVICHLSSVICHLSTVTCQTSSCIYHRRIRRR